MEHNFEIKCEKCGNTAVVVKGVATIYEAYKTKVRIKFTCLSCGYEAEIPTIQGFKKDLRKKKEKIETLGNLIRANLKYTEDGKEYRKIGRYEKIAKGAMQSWDGQDLQPIRNPRTVDDVPAHFAIEREFYNPT